jgi:hypothetical protein
MFDLPIFFSPGLSWGWGCEYLYYIFAVLEVGLEERERGWRVLLLWQFVRVRREKGKSFYLYQWKWCLLVRDLFFEPVRFGLG